MTNNSSETLLALDVGAARIGVAQADTRVKLAYPLETVEVDGDELWKIETLLRDMKPSKIVVGYPRNQSGEATQQTALVEKFAEQLRSFDCPIVFQDESLTSVLAEERLKRQGKPYTRAMIDAEAASIILQDYMEMNYGH